MRFGWGCRRQAGSDDAVGRHADVADNRRAGRECAPGDRRHVAPEREVADDIGHAAGVDQPNRDVGDVGRQVGEISLRADRRERAAVDLVRIAEVIGHRSIAGNVRGKRHRPVRVVGVRIRMVAMVVAVVMIVGMIMNVVGVGADALGVVVVACLGETDLVFKT